MTTNVPAPVFSATGVIAPAESDILAGVQADINAAFGGNVNPSLKTPQGQLASSTTAIIGANNDLFIEYVNQVDPDTASGRMQDAIGRIYFLDRLPAESTSVQVLCTGRSGVVIGVGALVIASDGNIYSCTQAGTIPIGGSITLPFAAQKTGPIMCSTGMISQIYQSIPGWDSATNVADGVIGRNVESRADFELRRKASVALNASGSLPSIYANVFDVANVLDVYVTENTTNASVTSGSITLLPHSIYVAAVGGLSQDIGNAIWLKKPPGADYNGNTSVTVTDTSGYAPPYPTYAVKYQIPAALPILFAVQLANITGLPSDIITQTKNAIIAAFTGQDGGPRARIGSTIYASRFYGPVSNILPGYVEIISLLIGTSTANLNSVSVDIGHVPTISAANISVTLVQP